MPHTLNPQVPPFASDLLERFYSVLSDGVRGEDSLTEVVESILDDLKQRDSPSRVEYLKACSVFETIRDVLRLYWRFEYDGTLLAHPPDLTTAGEKDIAHVKDRIQESLTVARDEQLKEPSTIRFVQEMEQPRPSPSNGIRRNVSVQDLFLSPNDLAKDLRAFGSLPVHRQLGELPDIIQPYLQLVDSKTTDKHTELRLIDIWRYARHTWSIPYSPVPGRRMLYLIRDGAREFDPIIGIGALGSGVIQLTPRDRAIGWSPLALAQAKHVSEHIVQQLNEQPTRSKIQNVREQAFVSSFGQNTWDVLTTLRRQLDEALDYIYVDDLLKACVLSPSDLESPSQACIDRLERKRDELRKASSNRDYSPTEEYEVDSQSDLYTRKRVTTLGRILAAKRDLTEFLSEVEGLDDESLRRMVVASSRARKSLKTALRSIKKRRIAGLMDITTCGAVPPYNEILGGKLVAFLMASPQVIADYRNRYKDQESVIASRMKGEAVIRNPELVLLSTTSLYAVGSSQYNRLKAPTANGHLKYKHIGKSLGHGHVHISNATFRTLVDLLDALENEEDSQVERPNYRFGNGVNYRMRTIKAALSEIGLHPLHQHEHPRLIYLAPLANNWKAYLTGKEDEPDYIYLDTQEEPQRETQALIDYWKIRWFYRRAQKDFVIERLENKYKKVQVSDLIPSDDYRNQAMPLFDE